MGWVKEKVRRQSLSLAAWRVVGTQPGWATNVGRFLTSCSSRATGQTYIAELKCELEYENYRFLTLTDAGQLSHHTTEAFQRFRIAARHPAEIPTWVGGKPVPYAGAVLVWGSVTSEGSAAVQAAYGFADAMSVEAMIGQLLAWKNLAYEDSCTSVRRGWVRCMPDYAGSRGKPCDD